MTPEAIIPILEPLKRPVADSVLRLLLKPLGPTRQVLAWADAAGWIEAVGDGTWRHGSAMREVKDRARVAVLAAALRRRGLYDFVAEVCMPEGFTVEEVLSHARPGPLVRVRFAVYVALLEHPRVGSLSEVGRLLGRDHSTILDGCRVHLARTREAA